MAYPWGLLVFIRPDHKALFLAEVVILMGDGWEGHDDEKDCWANFIATIHRQLGNSPQKGSLAYKEFLICPPKKRKESGLGTCRLICPGRMGNDGKGWKLCPPFLKQRVATRRFGGSHQPRYC